MVTRGGLITVTLGSPQRWLVLEPLLLELAGVLLLQALHRGDITKFFSAERGWSLSGERARRKSGDPGSADFGLESARCLAAGETESEAPGLKSCVE